MTFPTFPTFPALDISDTRSVVASTLRQPAISGRNTFQPLWPYPKYKITRKYNALAVLGSSYGGDAEWQELEDFWKTVMFASPGGVFQINLDLDNTATGQAVGTGDGTTVSFQLMRALYNFPEPVLAPTTYQVYVNSVLTAVSAPVYGIVTFAAAPVSGAAITWSGTYDWLAQFDEDTVDLDRLAFYFRELKKVTLTTWHP
jgi:hypothetical protein